MDQPQDTVPRAPAGSPNTTLRSQEVRTQTSTQIDETPEQDEEKGVEPRAVRWCGTQGGAERTLGPRPGAPSPAPAHGGAGSETHAQPWRPDSQQTARRWDGDQQGQHGALPATPSPPHPWGLLPEGLCVRECLGQGPQSCGWRPTPKTIS